MTDDQLALFDAPADRNAPRGTKASLGLAKEGLGRGAERLLVELLKRGLDREHLEMAAALALALEEGATR